MSCPQGKMRWGSRLFCRVVSCSCSSVYMFIKVTCLWNVSMLLILVFSSSVHLHFKSRNVQDAKETKKWIGLNWDWHGWHYLYFFILPIRPVFPNLFLSYICISRAHHKRYQLQKRVPINLCYTGSVTVIKLAIFIDKWDHSTVVNDLLFHVVQFKNH